jgi:hypothetical protein
MRPRRRESRVLAEPHTMLVEARWTQGTDRSTQAPFWLFGPAGQALAKVYVNQQKNGGQWVTLGTFAFAAGQSSVGLSRWTKGTGVVVADAVRVTPLD